MPGARSPMPGARSPMPGARAPFALPLPPAISNPEQRRHLGLEHHRGQPLLRNVAFDTMRGCLPPEPFTSFEIIVHPIHSITQGMTIIRICLYLACNGRHHGHAWQRHVRDGQCLGYDRWCHSCDACHHSLDVASLPWDVSNASS